MKLDPGRVGNWRGRSEMLPSPPIPPPAASHVACGFPAIRLPAYFTTRVTGFIGSKLVALTSAFVICGLTGDPANGAVFSRRGRGWLGRRIRTRAGQ